MAVRLILSDLHFGDPLCTLGKRVSAGLAGFARGLGPVSELVLAGDILDGNVSTLTAAIEGRRGRSGHPGFRQWLAGLVDSSGMLPGSIVYVPGNHDYIVWNILATQRNFVEPLAAGRRLTGDPLMEGTFMEPFIRGAAPGPVRDRFIVRYPDHAFEAARRKILVTHGHYLDRTQSLFRNLDDLVRDAGGDERKAVRRFFITTAQYQAVAGAVSYRSGTRSTVDRIHKRLGSVIDLVGRLRGKGTDRRLALAVQYYLRYFRRASPDIFIFGHTHEASHASSADFSFRGPERLMRKDFDIWNAGCFVATKGSSRAGTFVVVDDADARVRLFEIDGRGRVRDLKA